MPDADDEDLQTKSYRNIKMKGTKDEKADGSKGAGTALFPRLHVAETKKAGPRGPPRNKMALYEQLAVPSRYKQSPMLLPSSGRMVTTPSMTTSIFQPQAQASSYDSRYSYMPMSYMSPTVIPTMAYMPIMNVGLYGVGVGDGAAPTSSRNASSTRSTVVDGTTESQPAPWGGETLSRGNISSGYSKQSLPSRKGKEDDDFAVPTYSATQARSQTRPSINPPQVPQTLRGGGGDVRKGKELVTDKRSPACSTQLRRTRKERSMEDDASWTSASVECLTASAIDNDVNIQDISNRKVEFGPREREGGQTKLYPVGIGLDIAKGQKADGEQSCANLAKPSDARAAAALPDSVHEDGGLRVVPEQDIFSSQSSENRSGEASEFSQRKRGGSAETESSMLENLPPGSICFRDVVDAFGQQEFWKSQKTIMRQQKLFSRQVFELHRLIEVQHLLAKSPSLSHNLDDVLEAEGDNVPLPSSPVAEVPEIPDFPESSGRLLEREVSRFSEEISRPVSESRSQPLQLPPSITSQQNFNSGAAWQAAPYSSNPYAARISPPYMYVPYPGPCSPGYGVYPMMGAPMSMYGNSGGMQASRFPIWQQPGMSQPWCPQDPTAAAAAAAAAVWYGQQVVPGGPTPTMGVVSLGTNSERLTSSRATRPLQGSNALKGNAWQGEETTDVEVKRSNPVNAVENSGRTKDRGTTENRWDREEPYTSQNNQCGAVPQSGEIQCRDYFTGREETGGGLGQPSDVGRMVEREEHRGEHSCRGGEPFGLGEESAGPKLEKKWPAGARGEEPLRSTGLKRPREVQVSDMSSWFSIMSPAKRIAQQNGVIKVVPRAVSATPESAASILLSIQMERQR